jgi:lysophospholipase L1-like esterase
MQKILIVVLIGSLILNVVAVWGFFHYIKYGGSPLGELKRRLTGTTKQKPVQSPFAAEGALTPESDSLRVVFLGASIMQRWNLAEFFPEIRYINRSIGGQFSQDILARYKRDVLDLKPRAVVIKLCSINIRPQISQQTLQDGIIMMTELATAHNITPILSTIIPAGKPEAHIGDFSVVDSLRQCNEWIRRYAADNSLALIDFEKALADEQGFLPREFSTDPVHVNDKGYAIMAETAKPVIYKALGIGAPHHVVGR